MYSCTKTDVPPSGSPLTGFKGQPVCFLFTDAEVKDEAFLEYINQILMTGEVAGALCASGQHASRLTGGQPGQQHCKCSTAITRLPDAASPSKTPSTLRALP